MSLSAESVCVLRLSCSLRYAREVRPVSDTGALKLKAFLWEGQGARPCNKNARHQCPSLRNGGISLVDAAPRCLPFVPGSCFVKASPNVTAAALAGRSERQRGANRCG
jgi:hypothetical protein